MDKSAYLFLQNDFLNRVSPEYYWPENQLRLDYLTVSKGLYLALMDDETIPPPVRKSIRENPAISIGNDSIYWEVIDVAFRKPPADDIQDVVFD